MANTNILFPSTSKQKTRDPKLWRQVRNLKIFRMMHIYKMAAIFRNFYNGQWQYSVSIDTQKPESQSFGAYRNLKFFCISIFIKCWPFYLFFHNGWCQYSVFQMQIFQWFSFPITTSLHNYFDFNIQALCLKHFIIVAIFWCFYNSRHWYFIFQMQIFHWFSFPITAPLHPWFSSNIQIWWCFYA